MSSTIYTTHAPSGGATVQQILQQYHTGSANAQVQHVLTQLTKCRTAKLGYHLYHCNNNDCGQFKYQYHSCRNRHCPACGALQKEQWIEARRNELLPIAYYHVVFTLPHELNSIILGNRKQLYNVLFTAASQTLLSFADNPKHLGATPGILTVLHTWGQQLSFHPHLHCIVSGGGIVTNKGQSLQWVNGKRNKDDFLFPVKAMAIVYRAKYLEALSRLIADQQIAVPADVDIPALIKAMYDKDWIVYAKKPFGGPEQVIEYLGRYTHKVAITNNRIKAVDDNTTTVTFDYKDYNCEGMQKQMQLPAVEFIRRFEMHILPRYFTKIRSYGYISNRNRKANISAITVCMEIPPHPPAVKIPWQVRLLERYKIQYNQCRHCGQLSLVLVGATFKEKFIHDG
jgi:hypothetical protein